MVAIIGTVTVAPWHKVSKAGNGYCEFSIVDKKNAPHHCIAFDRAPFNLAKKLSEELGIGTEIAVHGDLKDRKVFVSSFTLSKALEGVQGSKFVPKPFPKSDLDVLMDILSPKYVTERFRSFCRTDDIRSVINREVNSKGYKALLSELKIEAAFVSDEKWVGEIFNITVD